MTIPFDELKRLEAEARKKDEHSLSTVAITRLAFALADHALPLITAAEQAEKMAELLTWARASFRNGTDLSNEIDAALRAYREAVG